MARFRADGTYSYGWDLYNPTNFYITVCTILVQKIELVRAAPFYKYLTLIAFILLVPPNFKTVPPEAV